MDNIELLECLIETEIKKLEYRISQAKKLGFKDKVIFMYKHQRAGLKKAISFIDEIYNMEE